MRRSMLCLFLIASGGSLASAQSDWVFTAPDLQVSYVPGATSLAFDVGFSMWQQSGTPLDAYGFSMAVAQDPLLLRPVDVVPGPASMSPSGDEPAYFAVEVHEGGWTCGVVFDGHGFWGLAYPDPGEVLVVTYEDAPGASFLDDSVGAICPLSWTDSLGIPPTLNSIWAGASVIPTQIDGAIVLAPSEFIRGDMNGDGALDIADVFTTESYLFSSGPVPDCLAALDANSDAIVDIADIIFLLSYLFIQGEQPAAPFPDCGANPGALACDSYSCP